MIKINDVIAFYYNSIGGNYDDTFGNTVILKIIIFVLSVFLCFIRVYFQYFHLCILEGFLAFHIVCFPLL